MKLNFKLREVVRYAHQYEDIRTSAVKQFFGKNSPDKLLEDETIGALFNEWVIFDFRSKFGTSLIVQYYLKNPDGLTVVQLQQLEQVIKTERYELMEILETKAGEGFSVYLIRTGEVLFIDDLAGSNSVSIPSLFFNRIAKVDNKFVLVGCDNVTFRKRLSGKNKKEFARILNKEKNTPKLLLDIFGSSLSSTK